mmetsp:Transcript_2877/g.8144  ORF Transcript_2877/g.8144 Transcript_2877/m.8144 type:complete len:241 (+) Transcript_2877:37-759(+)
MKPPSRVAGVYDGATAAMREALLPAQFCAATAGCTGIGAWPFCGNGFTASRSQAAAARFCAVSAGLRLTEAAPSDVGRDDCNCTCFLASSTCVRIVLMSSMMQSRRPILANCVTSKIWPAASASSRASISRSFFRSFISSRTKARTIGSFCANCSMSGSSETKLMQDDSVQLDTTPLFGNGGGGGRPPASSTSSANATILLVAPVPVGDAPPRFFGVGDAGSTGCVGAGSSQCQSPVASQ